MPFFFALANASEWEKQGRSALFAGAKLEKKS